MSDDSRTDDGLVEQPSCTDDPSRSWHAPYDIDTEANPVGLTVRTDPAASAPLSELVAEGGPEETREWRADLARRLRNEAEWAHLHGGPNGCTRDDLRWAASAVEGAPAAWRRVAELEAIFRVAVNIAGDIDHIVGTLEGASEVLLGPHGPTVQARQIGELCEELAARLRRIAAGIRGTLGEEDQ